MRKTSRILTFVAAALGLVSAIVGVFYTFGGDKTTVSNIYGKEFTLFGDGIYLSDTLKKAGSQKGADIVSIVLCILLITTIWLHRKTLSDLLRAGLLSGLMYVSTCLIIGMNYNVLFPLYLLQFSSTLFAFIFTISDLMKRECFDAAIYNRSLKGTAVFLFLGGSSTLIWVVFIIYAEITGDFSSIKEIYTTEPSFVFDTGIILPCSIGIGIGLLKRKKWAYNLASVIMMLFISIGPCVILGTVFQMNYGITYTTKELVGPVGIFILLAVAAMLFNIGLMKHIKE